MHERAVCKEIIDIVTRASLENNINSVTNVLLEIGDFSCINDDQLKYNFDLFKSDTLLKCANLEIKKVDAKAFCEDCKEIFVTKLCDYKCPICSSRKIKVISGFDTVVKNISGV